MFLNVFQSHHTQSGQITYSNSVRENALTHSLFRSLQILPAGQPGGYATAAALVNDRTRRWGIPDPPRVEEPAEVNFRKEAAGWPTGALVIDLEVRFLTQRDSLLTFASSFIL